MPDSQEEKLPDSIFADADDLDEYVESYGDLEVHKAMMKDTERLKAYHRAVCTNKDFFKDKVVLDIGAGLGILTFIVLNETDARFVLAVEQNETALQNLVASAIENRIDGRRLRCLQMDAGDVTSELLESTVGVKKADIIISEWMGHYLVHENMLPTVTQCRDAILNEPANPLNLFPNRATLYASLFKSDSFLYDQKLWAADAERFFGLKFSVLAKTEPPIIEHLGSREDLQLGPHVILSDLDLTTVQSKDLDEVTYTGPMELKSDRADGVVVWFDCQFPGSVLLSTGPSAPETHWKQTIVFFPRSLEKTEDAKLSMKIRIIRTNGREYTFTIEAIEHCDPEPLREFDLGLLRMYH